MRRDNGVARRSPLPFEAYANVCSQVPPPYPVVRARFDRALAVRDLASVRAAARENPSIVTLADAVEVLVMMLDADDASFEDAAVRWLARFAAECAGVTLGELLAAIQALDALPAEDARFTLIALLRRHLQR